eukprot:CAMPEP_0169473902 /NCGR_PEP_ID=MMETSP1042-20121227/25961_1 /TAXON_ID=464988 /ORGANISM="Hemiselmis andersenii, Strain CCMP1180" /LENGTH=70 /DNA_ID=CAMNT_0009587877 /DNA_START=202 /DNA_END=409 /DNA_ORIENTATION=+
MLVLSSCLTSSLSIISLELAADLVQHVLPRAEEQLPPPPLDLLDGRADHVAVGLEAEDADHPPVVAHLHP